MPMYFFRWVSNNNVTCLKERTDKCSQQNPPDCYSKLSQRGSVSIWEYSSYRNLAQSGAVENTNSLLYLVIIVLNHCYWTSLCLFEGFTNIYPMKSIQKSSSLNSVMLWVLKLSVHSEQSAARLGYFNTVAVVCFSCPRVEVITVPL